MALSMFNISVGVEFTDESLFVKIENNTISGLVGKYLSQLFSFRNKKNWTLKPIKCFDDENPAMRNGSFVFMAKNKLIDILAFPRKDKFFNENLDKSKTCLIQPHQLGQVLAKPTDSEKNDLLTFLFNNKNFLIIILIGYLLLIFINFTIISLINLKNIKKFRTQFTNIRKNKKAKFRAYRKSKIIKIRFADLLFLNYNNFSFEIALINLFFHFFMLFVLSFLTSAINTDSIVVNTDDFLNEQYKILNSSKKFVFDQQDRQIFAQSPKTSFLYKLYNKKVNKEGNYYEIPIVSTERKNEGLNNLLENLLSFFMIKERETRLAFLSYISHLYKDNQFLYLDDVIYYEEYYIIFMRKSLEKKIKKLINQSIDFYFEAGLYRNFYERIHEQNLRYIRSKIRIYFNAEEFIEDSSSSSNVDLHNFKNIFIYFLSIMIIIVLIFILDLLVIFSKRLIDFLHFDLTFSD